MQYTVDAIWNESSSTQKSTLPCTATNEFVVSYNPYSLQRFQCYINSHLRSTIQDIRYSCKYCSETMKKPELANVILNQHNPADPSDEILQYLATRYVCPPEAMFRSQQYKLYYNQHAIYRLAVHLENQQYIYFKGGPEKECIDKNHDTTLTAWFKLNQHDPSAQRYLYTEIPQHYVFDKVKKQWFKRKLIEKPIISCMYFVNPLDHERFYIRILLQHIRGATSFEELRTIDGKECQSFAEVVHKRNLIQTDSE